MENPINVMRELDNTEMCHFQLYSMIVQDIRVWKLAYSVFFLLHSITEKKGKRGREKEEKRREGRSAAWQMSPNQLPLQNIALATAGMEREGERGRKRETQKERDGGDAEPESDKRHEREKDGGLG